MELGKFVIDGNLNSLRMLLDLASAEVTSVSVVFGETTGVY